MRPNAARLSRRTQRTTVQARSDKPSTAKVHEEYDAGEPQISEEHRVAQRIQRVTETGGVLAHAGLPECFYHKGHEGHNEHVAGAGRACAQGTRPARRPVGAWRASHATLWFFGSPPGEPRRINLPRETIRHFVAPQGRSVLRSLFSVLRGASVPLVLPRRVMARRRRAGGAGAVGSLEAWMLGSLVSLHNDCFVARLPLALFSVFCGLGSFGPLGLPALFSGAC